MEKQFFSRRGFIGASAVASAAAISSAAGIKPSDLPDLTVKGVKVHKVKDYSHVVSITTSSTGRFLQVSGLHFVGQRAPAPLQPFVSTILPATEPVARSSRACLASKAGTYG